MSDVSRVVEPKTRQISVADESGLVQHVLKSPSGLQLSLSPSGCVHAIESEQILISQVLSSPLAGSIHRIFLRIHEGSRICHAEIVGPRAQSKCATTTDRIVWTGTWRGLGYRCTCWLHPRESAWFFSIEVKNGTPQSLTVDAVALQDIGLATRGQVRNNERYTSQYIDHSFVRDSLAGFTVVSRQTQAQPGASYPCLLSGCLPGAAGFTTDGMDLFGPQYKADATADALDKPVIGQRIRQGELAYVGLQSNPATIAPGSDAERTFFGLFLANSPPGASADVPRLLESIRARRADSAPAQPSTWEEAPVGGSVFQTAELMQADDLTDSEVDRLFPGPKRHVERREGRLHSFFHAADSRHVVLRQKEVTSERPHGHILRAGQGTTPQAEIISSTSYAAGVFACQLAVGNTTLAKFVSTVRDPLNLVRSGGLRILVRHDSADPWRLLALPSAFEMSADGCCWYYKQAEQLLTVQCASGGDDPALTFDIQTDGRPVEMLIAGEIAAGSAEYEASPRLTIDASAGRITIHPDPESLLGRKCPGIALHLVTPLPDRVQSIGGDELLHADAEPRGYPYFCIHTRATQAFSFTFVGSLDQASRTEALCAKYQLRAPGHSLAEMGELWAQMTGGVKLSHPRHTPAAVLQDTLAWFARDAVVHLSTPRGLEQPNGGAWGVRDVCQGSVEFLLSYGHDRLIADVVRNVFSHQYLRRGDWPQWFMFPPFNEIQSSHCHGDVLIWPLKALCDYLEQSDDSGVLGEQVCYTDDETFQRTSQTESLIQHVDRLLDKLQAEFLPGLSLPRYGEGDWDDSLQPADPLLRDRMVSSWTSALVYQTLRRYALALSHFGETARCQRVQAMADAVQADFQRHLVSESVVAGFALFEGNPPAPSEFLLHPSDTRTGLHYRLIPMTRGIISGVFSAEQARQHLDLVQKHLVFPDGARLMDRPTTYRGGVEQTFRRSESASFFGREIGLQYVHAHLRYAEALATMGRADEIWHALLVASPIAVTDVVSNARPRQRNCYFSSSDAAFRDRYEASREYDKLRTGDIPVDGGWRIYSSGPGIYTNLVIRHLLGIRRHFDFVEFDPVLPRALDGISCELTQEGRRVAYRYAVRSGNHSPKRIAVNGVPLTGLVPSPNPYRQGGVRLPRAQFMSALSRLENVVEVEI